MSGAVLFKTFPGVVIKRRVPRRWWRRTGQRRWTVVTGRKSRVYLRLILWPEGNPLHSHRVRETTVRRRPSVRWTLPFSITWLDSSTYIEVVLVVVVVAILGKQGRWMHSTFRLIVLVRLSGRYRECRRRRKKMWIQKIWIKIHSRTCNPTVNHDSTRGICATT